MTGRFARATALSKSKCGSRNDGGASPDEELDLACACGRPACGEHVLITVETYLRVHADPDRFVVFPGHADRSTTAVLERGPVYEVVRAVSAGRTSS